MAKARPWQALGSLFDFPSQLPPKIPDPSDIPDLIFDTCRAAVRDADEYQLEILGSLQSRSEEKAFRSKDRKLLREIQGIDAAVLKLLELLIGADRKVNEAAYRAFVLGMQCVVLANRRNEHEAAIGKTMRQSASSARSNRGFNPTRDELIQLLRQAYHRYRCSQNELAEHVAERTPVGKERIRQLMRKHAIRKSDYEK